MRYRQHNQNEPICQKCLIKIQKSGQVFAALPSEFHYQVFKNELDFDLAVKYLLDVSSTIPVKFSCRVCTQVDSMRWSNFKRRKHKQFENICLKCLNNVIQTDPDKLKSNSRKSKFLWQNSDYRLECLKAFAEHNKNMQLDPGYANRHRRKSKSITGSVIIAGQEIVFDSGFELIFLWNTREKYTTLRRCEYAIAYGSHFYHPDFFVIDNTGKRTIIEIKGYYDNNVASKQEAAEQYIAETNIADAYILYTTEKLLDDGILTGLGGCRMWKQIGIINNETTISFADSKHQRIAEIGVSRHRRETKNQKDHEITLCR